MKVHSLTRWFWATSLMLLLAPNPTSAKQATYPTTNLFAGAALSPTFHYGDIAPRTLGAINFFSLALEVPIYSYLHAGFVVRNAIFFDDRVGNAHRSFSDYYTLVNGLEFLIKSQLPIHLGSHRLSPYLQSTLGLSVALNAGLTKAKITPSPAVVGLGPSGTLVCGIEYFPISLIGVFVEGGIQASFLTHRLADTELGWKFYSYGLTNWILGFGVKLGI